MIKTQFKFLIMNNLLSSLILFCCLTIVGIPDGTAQLKNLKVNQEQFPVVEGSTPDLLKTG